MIAGSLILAPAFPAPGLIWRELRFLPDDRFDIATDEDPAGPLRIVLPDDLRKAAAKRRREFLAGRLCAGLALRAAGRPPNLPRRGRAPLWPAGIAGSISHNDSRAVAVVSTRHAGLGVDLEEIMPETQARALQGRLLAPGEAGIAPDLPLEHLVTLAFSAKEALYKALSHRLTRIPDFHEARLVGIGPEQAEMAFDGAHYRLHYRFGEGDCLTLVALSD